ncbi:MAG: hypothetical protein Q7S36_02295 [Candidatus Liptonbacteria bacterium]|nr:hypothetical protein [Candidatus Liptonbacteria bacterium]
MKLPMGERPEVRIVGSGAPEEKERYGRQILESFGEKHGEYIPEDLRELIKKTELEKTENELVAIAEANKITNEMLRAAGLPEFDVPPANIHFVPSLVFAHALGNRENGNGATYIDDQAIVLNADENRKNAVWGNEIILHEMIHLKGYSAFEVDAEGNRQAFRSGLRVVASHKKKKEGGNFDSFRWLNEAIVTEIAAQNLKKLIDNNGQLAKEREWLDSEEAAEFKKQVAEMAKIGPEEILWATEKEIISHPYRSEREVLDYMVGAISEDLGLRPEETRDKFFGAHFTGHLLEIAHLIEKTFGKGSFEILGMMDAKTDQPKIMGYLKRHRRLAGNSKDKEKNSTIG